MACVNINLPEVKELAEKLQAPIGVIGAAINSWQLKNNDYEKFPTYEELKDYLYKTNNVFTNTNKVIIKEGVEELFDSNPELANQVYSKILTNSGISGKNLLSLLLKDNIIEKQCS